MKVAADVLRGMGLCSGWCTRGGGCTHSDGYTRVRDIWKNCAMISAGVGTKDSREG